MDTDGIAARIQELTLERQQFHMRNSQLQKELSDTVVHIHQLDGAIAVLEQLIPKEPV